MATAPPLELGSPSVLGQSQTLSRVCLFNSGHCRSNTGGKSHDVTRTIKVFGCLPGPITETNQSNPKWSPYSIK